MPNYCQNQATFTHADKEKVDALFNEFEKVIESDGRDGKPFQLLHPIPTGEEANWYNWRIANWGTKWDAMTAWDLERQDDNSFTVSFHTAWAPPLDWYRAIEGNDWEVDAVYFEAGVGAAGSYSEGCEDTMEVTPTLYRILNARFNTAA